MWEGAPKGQWPRREGVLKFFFKNFAYFPKRGHFQNPFIWSVLGPSNIISTVRFHFPGRSTWKMEMFEFWPFFPYPLYVHKKDYFHADSLGKAALASFSMKMHVYFYFTRGPEGGGVLRKKLASLIFKNYSRIYPRKCFNTSPSVAVIPLTYSPPPLSTDIYTA